MRSLAGSFQTARRVRLSRSLDAGSLDRDELFTQEYRRWETSAFCMLLPLSYAETYASIRFALLPRAGPSVILSE